MESAQLDGGVGRLNTLPPDGWRRVDVAAPMVGRLRARIEARFHVHLRLTPSPVVLTPALIPVGGVSCEYSAATGRCVSAMSFGSP